MSDQTQDKPAPTVQQPEPLLPAMPAQPALPAQELRSLATQDQGLDYAMAVTRDVATRMFKDGDAALEGMLARYVEKGDAPKIISELERDPSSFGDLKGAARLGLANAERRNVLEQSPMLADKARDVFQQVSAAEAQLKGNHDIRRDALAKPLPDLSPNAQQFLQNLSQVQGMAPGQSRTEQMTALMKDTSSVREVTNFRAALSDRYGKGQDNIRRGVAQDPAFKDGPDTQRQLANTRVNAVLIAFPQMVQMQEQVRSQTRTRDLGKDQSKGIER